MESPILAFESENNPLRESMKQMLDQLPHNSEQLKSIFKSLLLVHISKMKDHDERSTWQSFINTLDNMSQSEQASYSFGPLSNSEHSKDFKSYLKLKKFQTDPFEFYYENLKTKSLFSLKSYTDIAQRQRKALKSAILVSLRLKYVEAFWKWHMLTAGIENIAEELYHKNLKGQVFSALKRNIYSQDLGTKYWKWKKTLEVLLNWAILARDSFRDKIKAKNRKKINFKEGIRPKYGPRSDSAEKLLCKNQANLYLSQSKQNFARQRLELKKKILEKVKIKYETKLNKRRSSKLFKAWIGITKSAIFIEKLASALSLPLFKHGFMKLAKNPPSSLQVIQKKYSIDNLTDYELSVKITIMERRLAGLHQELLSEQITSKSLLAEKEQLYKLLG